MAKEVRGKEGCVKSQKRREANFILVPFKKNISPLFFLFVLVSFIYFGGFYQMSADPFCPLTLKSQVLKG